MLKIYSFLFFINEPTRNDFELKTILLSYELTFCISSFHFLAKASNLRLGCAVSSSGNT